MSTSHIQAQYLTINGLVRAFYESYEDGSPYDTRELAMMIREKDEEGLMENHPLTVVDAKDELSTE